MPRIARIVIPGIAYHITQRGNNQQDAFFTDNNRKLYLELLTEQSDKYGLRLLGYCLMSNHVHIIGIPLNEDSLAKAIGRTHYKYTQYINYIYKRTGHLWHGRFYSCALDNAHFLSAMRYIECNPVRARICREPWMYIWSSASYHIDERQKSEVIDLSEWYKDINGDEWKKMLLDSMSEEELYILRRGTHAGRPIGNESFLSKLEKRLGQGLRALPVGRPRKNSD